MKKCIWPLYFFILILCPTMVLAKAGPATFSNTPTSSHPNITMGNRIDTSFGTSGVVTIDISETTYSYIEDMIVTDDYIIVTGTSLNSSTNLYNCVTALLDKEGTVLDTATTQYFESYHRKCHTMALDDDGFYAISEANNESSYGVILDKFTITNNELTHQDYTYDFTSSSFNAYSSLIMDDTLYIAGSYSDDLYLEKWSLSSLSSETSYSFDGNEGLTGSGGYDYAYKILKNDEGNLYLIGTVDIGSYWAWAILRLEEQSGSWVADDDFGLASGFWRATEGLSDGSGYYLPYIYDAALDEKDNIYVTGKFITGSTENIYFGAVNSKGTYLGYSDRIDDFEGGGDSILVNGDYAYVGGYQESSDGDNDFILIRYKNGTKDTDFNSDGIITKDFHGYDDGVKVMARDDNKLYLAGYSSTSSSERKYTIVRYSISETSDDDDDDAEDGSGEGEGETTCTATASTESLCYDGTDDECDGLVDCDDDECTTSVFCTGITAETNCTDGLDDEGDGSLDCGDSDCVFDAACVTSTESDCTDTADNDGDSLTDCDDSDCAADAACLDVDVDPSPEIIAAAGSGCGCNFTATSPRGFRSLGYLVVMVVAVVALMARKRRQKK